MNPHVSGNPLRGSVASQASDLQTSLLFQRSTDDDHFNTVQFMNTDENIITVSESEIIHADIVTSNNDCM